MGLLVFSCIITPYQIAFTADVPFYWKIINYVTDFLFFIDILIIFDTCFYDDDLVVVEDRCEISSRYVKGQFFIDFMAIIPFDTLLGGGGANSMVRLSRLGRM